jgi:hypothetical protein
MTTTTEAEVPILPCQACRIRPATLPDIVCGECRAFIRKRDAGPAGLAPIFRLVRALCTEIVYGLFVSIITTLSILIATIGASRLIDLLGISILPLLFLLPLIATLRTYAVRPYITRAGVWGWLSVAQLGIMTLLMCVAVTWGGLRFTTWPMPVLLIGVAIVMWALGVGVARLQESYLPGPQQQRDLWRWWALRGWTLGAIAQVGVGLLIDWPGRALANGMLVGVAIYHIYAQLLLRRFMREANRFKEIQKEYQDVWYNR